MVKTGKPTYSWGDIKERIFKLSSKIQSLIKEGDRCLILSENRPYWLMADIACDECRRNIGSYFYNIFIKRL
jgi:long-chain acyl-CoA synthetase